MPPPPRLRPTHFLSLRLTPAKVPAFEQFRSHVASAHPELLAHVIPAVQIHLTLFVVRMTKQNETDMLSTFHSTKEIISTLLKSPLTLHLRGVGTFANGRVVWTSPKDGPDSEGSVATLKALARAMHSLFRSRGLVDDDTAAKAEFEYTPHVTLMKVKPRDEERREPPRWGKSQWNRPSRSAGDVRVIPPQVFLPFVETDFGWHVIDKLDFLEMAKDENGHYPVVATVDIP
ncbi:kinase A anchor protein [Zopfochytrium polystomum]|nr:kinase A anchor protein [Zopfochytrium polystomum]